MLLVTSVFGVVTFPIYVVCSMGWLLSLAQKTKLGANEANCNDCQDDQLASDPFAWWCLVFCHKKAILFFENFQIP